MSNDKKRVLIVDDSTDDIHVLMENLKRDYAVLAATSGRKALAMANKAPHPDVILMDVMMPDLDGYQTCRQLKEHPETQDIDIIFISAQDTTEEKLAGYDAGGSDYLIKPVQPSELQQKVKLAIKHRDAHAESAAEKSMMMQTAMTAITSAGEQGVVLDFMRRSFTVQSMEELATLVVETTANYGLENSVQIRSSIGAFNASTSDSMSPLEIELLSRLKDAGRLKTVGRRLIANFGNVSMLIKNMPDDEDKSGRLRDHLAILLEGAEIRLQALEMAERLAELVADSNQALQDIGVQQKRQKEAALQIMDDVMKELEASFMRYGLTEEQEQRLLKVVQTGIDKSLENFEQGLKIDAQLRAIVDRLITFSSR